MEEKWIENLRRRMADYQAPAPEMPWAEIEQAVARQRRGRTIGLWWRRAAAAVLLLLVVGGGYLLLPTPETTGPRLASTSPSLSLTPSAETSPRVRPQASTPPSASPSPSPAAGASVRVRPQTDPASPVSSGSALADASESSSALPANEVIEAQSEPSTRQEDGPARVVYPSELPSVRRSNRLLARVSASAMSGYDLGRMGDMDYASNPAQGGGGPEDIYASASAPVSIPASAYHHRQPVRFSATLRYQFTERWGLETGLSYTRLSADVSKQRLSTSGDGILLEREYSAHQQLSYLGIPLSVSYRVWANRRFSFYVQAGGMVEKMVHGRRHVDDLSRLTLIQTGELLDVIDNTRTEHLTIRPLQLSVSAAVGMDVNLYKGLSLYAEPGVSYFIDNHSHVPTIYQEEPFNLNLNVGLRLNIK